MNYIQNQIEIQGNMYFPTFLMPSCKQVSLSLMSLILDSSILYFRANPFFFHLLKLKSTCGLAYGGWGGDRWEFAGRNGGGVGCRVSETTKPAFSTMPPCPVASPPLQLLPGVANQIKSLQDNSLIPCQTKVCKQTTEKLGRC